MQRNKKGLSVLVLLTFLFTTMFSGVAWASFSDVPSNHWAIQNLNRMNARDVIRGYEDGTARPNNAVTQFEAMIMAARIAGLESKASAVAQGTYLPFAYPDWTGAYAMAVVGYENGLIDASDFTHNAPASRQWIAKLMIKAMGQESNVAGAAGQYLTFTDSAAIGNSYLNYVKLATQLGLISGYTDGSFQPTKSVTRAEMAAFLTRVENQMPVTAGNVVIGTVASINGVNLKITASNGTEVNLYATTNSNLYDKTGSSIGVTSLQVGDPVYAVTKNSLLSYLEVTDGTVGNVTVAANVEGKITSVILDKQALVITSADGKLNTVVATGSTVIITDQNKSLTFADLAVNDTVKVVSDANQNATKIVLVSANSAQTNGTIYNVDVMNNLITIQEKTGLKTYKMATNITVSISGMLTATTSSLKEGDVATYTLSDGIMTAIAVAGNNGNFGGAVTVKSIDTDNMILNYLNSQSVLQADYYTASTVITFSDGQTATISDINVNDKLQVTVSNNKITKIVIQDRTSSEGIKGTVYAIDRVNNVLTLTNNAGTKTTYDISPSVKVTLYGETVNLSSVTKDMQVELTLVNNKVTKIKANDRIEGEVTALSTTSSTITVKVNGLATVYDVDSSVTVYRYNSTAYRLGNVNIGDTVSMKMYNNEVTAIYVHSEQNMTVTSVYSTYIKATDSNGNTKTLYLSDIDIIINGISGNDPADLSTGDSIVATYEGQDLISVNTMGSVSGEITSINVNTNVVTVKTFSQKTQSITFGNGSYIVKNGSNYNGINSLAVGDRVIVSATSSTARCFTVLKSKTGKLQYCTTSVLKFLDSATLYKPLSGCYAHKSTSTYSLDLSSALTRDDSVTIYYDNDNDLQVYEIVKN